jgi:hypothetical protein
MRRFLFAVAVLLLVTASPAFAGYIIIRVLLEGGGAPTPAGGSEIGPMMPSPRPGGGGRPTGPSGPSAPGGPTGGGGYGSGTYGQPGMVGPPGVAGAGASGAAEIDHTRAVVILVPLETDLLRGALDPRLPKNDQTNPEFRRLIAWHQGRQLKASLFVDSSTIQLYEDLIAQPAPKKTRGTELRERYSAWQRGKNDTQSLYDALILALESGAIRDASLLRDGTPAPDAMKIAQELLDAAADKKPLSAAAQRFVQAWGEMAKAVRMPAPQPSAAEDWKSRLDAANVRTDGHYSVIYWDSSDNEVIRRSTQLNDNFYAFYLLHAVRGVVLPVPDKPFVVVLARQGVKFNQLRPALDGLPSQTDAFYSPEHDLLVLSPELMDAVGLTFQRQNQQYFVKGFSRDQLLAGQIPKIDAKGASPTAEEVARASTLAFVEKFVVEEAEVAAISREGTRQLLFATGGLPKHVTLPNWLTQGALNSYTRPRGPAYVFKGDDDKPYMSVAFTTGYGVPNYVNHRYLRDLDSHKELNADRVKLLEHILTDAYFTGIKDAIDPDPAPPPKKKKPATAPRPAGTSGDPELGGPGPMGPMGPRPTGPGTSIVGPMFPGPMGVGAASTDDEDPFVLLRKKRERLTIKAQATAWALYYYLARARSAELQQYLAELNKLPRDLPIDGRTAQAAFVRVFKLSTTDDGVPDSGLMRQFAKDWWDYISVVPTGWYDVPLVVPEPPKAGGMTPMGGTSIGPLPGGRPGGGK